MAISELITFDGGLSTKIDPHLISRNEAVICQNVNLENGVLTPLQEMQFIENVKGEHLYVYGSSIITNDSMSDNRFYDEYAGRLYWTDGVYGSYGLLRYDSTVTPDPDVGVDAEAPNPYDQATYPITVSTSTVIGQLSNAEYTYAVTLVDSDGIESVPVVIGSATATKNKSIKLCVDSASVTTYLTSITSTVNIYRTGGDNPTFNLVVEGMSPTHPLVQIDGSDLCYYDSVADINVSRIELTSFENYAPNDNMDMLIELKGTFYGAVDKRVYFSQTGRPEFWHPLDYVQLDRECTGLGKFGDTIIAFTRTSAYTLSGNNRDNIVLQRMPFNQGCVNKHTVANIDAFLIWTSLNGICLFDGANIQVLTKKSIAWDEFARVGNATFHDITTKWDGGSGFSIKYAAGYQDKYYGVFNNGIVIIDLSSGLKVSTIYVENVTSVAFNREDDFLYVIVDKLNGTFDVHALINSGTNMEATWKTGRLTDGSINIKKHYRQVTVDGVADTINVYVDTVLKHTATNQEKFMLPSGCIGDDIQFEIITTSEVEGLKYQYTELKG
jgi:hypothetical protein